MADRVTHEMSKPTCIEPSEAGLLTVVTPTPIYHIDPIRYPNNGNASNGLLKSNDISPQIHGGCQPCH